MKLESIEEAYGVIDESESIYDQIDRKIELELVKSFLHILSDREKFVVIRALGLDGNPPERLRDMGRVNGVHICKGSRRLAFSNGMNRIKKQIDKIIPEFCKRIEEKFRKDTNKYVWSSRRQQEFWSKTQYQPTSEFPVHYCFNVRYFSFIRKHEIIGLMGSHKPLNDKSLWECAVASGTYEQWEKLIRQAYKKISYDTFHKFLYRSLIGEHLLYERVIDNGTTNHKVYCPICARSAGIIIFGNKEREVLKRSLKPYLRVSKIQSVKTKNKKQKPKKTK